MDRNEINLRELLEILWKGKHLIAGITIGFAVIGILLSFVVIPTMFESTVYIDPTPYEISNAELNQEVERASLVWSVARELVDAPYDLIKRVELETTRESRLMKITVTYPSAEKAQAAAEMIGLGILELARALRKEKLAFEQQRLERLLGYIDEHLADYEDSDSNSRQSGQLIILEMDPVQKHILSEKGETMVKLQAKTFEFYDLEYNPAYEPDQWIRYAANQVTARPVNKVLYTTIAAFLGLTLSCFILLIRQSVSAPDAGAETGLVS